MKILEIGFGTGLNAVLTHLEANRRDINVTYHGIDLYPPGKADLEAYYSGFDEPIRSSGLAMIKKTWNAIHKCGDLFSLKKIQADFTKTDFNTNYHLVYFDAFSPEVHSEAWKTCMFQKIYSHMLPNGILVTFSSKGLVKRNLKDVGFSIKILPGPPGKRHILQAMKNS